MKYRVFDLLSSILLLIFAFPIFIICIILVKLENPKAPVYFKQVRVGLHGKKFLIVKFRTMVVNAEEQLVHLKHKNERTGPVFKMKEDPRITSIGKYLRKYSLDELPQLLNVIRGDMSLVGPRPPLVSEYHQYNDRAKKRLTVKPGCTGLWQVSKRNIHHFNDMLELDLKYISEQSIFLNTKIILKTFIKMTIYANGY